MSLRTLPERVVHDVKQVIRELRRRPGHAPLRLSGRHAVLVDGANIASAEDLTRVLAAARESGARVILAGRTGIERSEFGVLAEQLSHSVGATCPVVSLDSDPLHPSGREREHGLWARLLGRQGSPKPVLTSWKDQTHLRSRELHGRAKSSRPRVVKVSGQEIFEGEPVLLGRDAPHLGVSAGDTGVVERIRRAPKLLGGDVLVVRLDRLHRRGALVAPIRVDVPLNNYRAVRLAYSITRRAAEGTAVEQSYRLEAARNQPTIDIEP